MRIILLLIVLSVSLRAQTPRPSQQPPVPLVATPLPEQDVTLTIHISSELATAIENDRRQYFIERTDSATGITSLVPVEPTLGDQILFRLQDYFNAVLSRFPPPSFADKQAAITAAQKAAQDAAAKAAQVTKK